MPKSVIMRFIILHKLLSCVLLFIQVYTKISIDLLGLNFHTKKALITNFEVNYLRPNVLRTDILCMQFFM